MSLVEFKQMGWTYEVGLVLMGWVVPKEIYITEHKKSPTIKNQQTNAKLPHELV